MLDTKSDQRVNIRFLVKLKKSATETYQMLLEAYGDKCLSRACVFEWHKRFLEGRDSVKDDDRPGRPRTSTIDENVKVRDTIRKDQRLSVHAVAEMLHMNRESVRCILTEELNCLLYTSSQNWL